jgi:hypothetical protein
MGRIQRPLTAMGNSLDLSREMPCVCVSDAPILTHTTVPNKEGEAKLTERSAVRLVASMRLVGRCS